MFTGILPLAALISVAALAFSFGILARNYFHARKEIEVLEQARFSIRDAERGPELEKIVLALESKQVRLKERIQELGTSAESTSLRTELDELETLLEGVRQSSSVALALDVPESEEQCVQLRRALRSVVSSSKAMESVTRDFRINIPDRLIEGKPSAVASGGDR